MTKTEGANGASLLIDNGDGSFSSVFTADELARLTEPLAGPLTATALNIERLIPGSWRSGAYPFFGFE